MLAAQAAGSKKDATAGDGHQAVMVTWVENSELSD